MTPNITDLALGSGLNFVLPYDNRQIVAVRIPVSGNTVNAEQDLEVFVKGNANLVHTWLTRSLFGGAPCARASAFNSNSSRLVVPHCHISNQGDTYFAQIIRAEGRDMSGGGSCGNSQVTVHARLSMETNAVNGTFSANTIGGAPTTLRIQRFGRDFGATRFLVKVNLPPLGMNDVVYGRLSNFDHNAGLSLTLFKGNHIDQNKTTYGVACDLGCASGPQAPSTNVAWADKCWHCGIGVHGPIFAYIDVTEQQGSVDALTVDMSVVVTSWTDLTDQFQTMSFPLAEHSLAFYTMVHTREEGTRVEIDVITGVSIEVNVYADNCGLRTLQTQYWCFKGVRCDIPVPKRGNVGSYYRKSARDSPDLDNTYRLVIRGFDSTFQIRYIFLFLISSFFFCAFLLVYFN